ncbi:YggS family pyridoxal phosphate-dependent enzyme [Moraxella nasovis]|uniref:YggS family pyridoxal phosphate-dependent enzyme n=1 Tax=Moraxella nasovis TaxID=2904121 RepID=UPI001F603A5D|nr:YggS family pyridoxal phosphate-dependent enzyme [Moraxella nasovis]UNU73736.1 YggS family pyridoxal phosphate-dependent enzyme [Moraxella nasovis]
MKVADEMIKTHTLLQNYQAVKTALGKANQGAGRKAGALLLAVSKTKPAQMIRELYKAGQVDFGENYLQEALQKQQELQDLPIIWHYIGSIQRNKTRDIATCFDWVHTVERALIARRLSQQREGLPPLNILIQVNIDDEDSKSGVLAQDLFGLIDEIIGLPNLSLRGLMIIPAKANDNAFIRTKVLFDQVVKKYNLPNWDTLSMGMSGDMTQAVAAGSTMVRVGTAIFGDREYS